MATNDSRQKMLENIDLMNNGQGYDVIIVSCGTTLQCEYWQSRLESVKGVVLRSDCEIFVVEEDWDGGAGNALGTFYAFNKACSLALHKGLDVMGGMNESRLSIGLYHTAGKGTRLAPLPGSENNNKPGVKLPASIHINGVDTPITILESVLKQTSIYASSRKGRLSVYWGDQLFIPSVQVTYTPTHHVDILCFLNQMPSEVEWIERGLDRYGLIAINSEGNAAQIEKVSHATAVSILSKCFSSGHISSVGVSLGSFSISCTFLTLLLAEFNQELTDKQGKLDADPHLWMPMTLDYNSYHVTMKAKGFDDDWIQTHFNRMDGVLDRLRSTTCARGEELMFLTGLNVGCDAYWWDYGQLKYYIKNVRAMVDRDSAESAAMRRFFGSSRQFEISSGTSFEEACRFPSSSNVHFDKCVVCNVDCASAVGQNSILVNVSAKRLRIGNNCLVYNVLISDRDELVVEDGEALVGVFDNEGRQTLFRSRVEVDGGSKQNWNEAIFGNPMSFDQLHTHNVAIGASSIIIEGRILRLKEDLLVSLQRHN